MAYCCMICSLLPAPAVADRAEAAHKKLGQIRARIESIHHDLQSNQRSQSQLEQKLRKLQLALNEKSRAMRGLKQQISAQQAQLNNLQNDRQRLNANLAKHRHTLTAQLRAAYYTGTQEHLKLLLNQQDPAILARILKYYEYLNRARIKSIQTAETTLVQLAQNEQSITQTKQQLSLLLAEQENQFSALKSTRTQHTNILTKLNQEINQDKNTIATLRRDEAHMQELIASLQGLFADIPPEINSSLSFVQQKGSLTWPARGPLLNRFGEARRGSDLIWHGIRIQAPRSTEVRSISHGRVAFADWLPGFGLILIIDHHDGYISLYGHNEALYKDTGDWVAANEIIASVGHNSGEPHSSLYFEIRHNGKPIDPAQWCRSSRG